MPERATPTREPPPAPERVSAQIERWLASERDKTLGALIDVFQEKSFALTFILLLGVPALPLPTGGATHVFELIAMLVALQLVVGRDTIWLPERWREVELGTGGARMRFIRGLMKVIGWIERFSRPRLRLLFDHRASNAVFGLLVIAGSLGAFLAPPFTGLDTLPALGVVRLARRPAGGLRGRGPRANRRWRRRPARDRPGQGRRPRHREDLLDRCRCAYSSSAGEPLAEQILALLRPLAAFALCAAEELGELSLRTRSKSRPPRSSQGSFARRAEATNV